MRVALDTNILINFTGIEAEDIREATFGLLKRIPTENLMTPTQCLGEMYSVLTRKTSMPSKTIQKTIFALADAIDIADSTYTDFIDAIKLASAHKLQMWDSLILTVSARNKCSILLTEDMQHGFSCNGITVINPYKSPVHPLLQKAMNE
jgi:predicted nucleic acid-binding protein